MKTYIPRPPRIEAIRILEANRDEILALPGVSRLQKGHYAVRGPEATSIVAPGEWIFRYVGTQQIHHMADEQFRATFTEEER